MNVYRKIQKQRKQIVAPVDTMGCASTPKHINGEDKKFRILVSLLLSSQTKDAVTHEAVNKLEEVLERLTPANVCDAPVAIIKQCLSKVGYHNKKLRFLLEIAKKYRNLPMPATFNAVIALPGIGKKMTYLYLQHACNVNAGIGVDTHVHRISKRIGLCDSNDPEKTRISLEKIFDEDEWQEINNVMVGFGQTICLPVKPKCHECAARFVCPSSHIAKE